ncbi:MULTISPECIES: hypothetical protein [unclassified Variovorax]|uniref:hypothetical protein n=1 Tax=unclassified Variovorax TaxID=663243 RepID=UPI001BD2B682|nr:MULTISPECIES: hypothetical protein [unclassified Variovorax]
MTSKQFFIRFGCCALLIAGAPFQAFAATSSENMASVEDIAIRLPTDMYRALVVGELDAATSVVAGEKGAPTRITFSLIKSKPVGGTHSDGGSVCMGGIHLCATAQSADTYWMDSATGQIRISDPTESVQQTRLGDWTAFEAFPLCGWSSEAGVHSPYGGQCYSVVLTSPAKTVAVQILLGRNSGCKPIEQCWAKPLAKLRRMMASAR